MSKVLLRGITSLALLFSMNHVALAQAAYPLPQDIDWPKLERLLLESPRAVTLKSRAAAARTEVGIAERIPNPEVSYTFYGRASGNSEAINRTQHQVQVEQALPLWGQRRARARTARAEEAASQAQVAVLRVDLLVQGKLAFNALLVSQARVLRIQASLSRLQELRKLISGRVKVGLFSAFDLTRAELELARFESARDDANAELVKTQGELAALLGAPDWQPRALGELGVPPLFELPNEDPSLAPANRVAAALERASQAQVDLTSRERLPSVSVTAGAYVTSDGSSTSGLVGLAVPVPLFDQGKAALARAEAQHATAQHTRRSAALATRAALLAALRELSERRRAYAPFQQTIPQQLTALRDMADASFRAGSMSALVVLDTLRAHLDVELESLDALSELLAADVRARALSGQITSD